MPLEFGQDVHLQEPTESLPTPEVSVWLEQALGSFSLQGRERTVPTSPPSLGGSGESRGSHQGTPAASVLWQTAVWPGHIRPVITAAGLARARGGFQGVYGKAT